MKPYANCRPPAASFLALALLLGFGFAQVRAVRPTAQAQDGSSFENTRGRSSLWLGSSASSRTCGNEGFLVDRRGGQVTRERPHAAAGRLDAHHGAIRGHARLTTPQYRYPQAPGGEV